MPFGSPVVPEEKGNKAVVELVLGVEMVVEMAVGVMTSESKNSAVRRITS